MNKYNPRIHHRRSIRLNGFNYSQEGLFFITLCCHNRECLFGEIKNGIMVLNQFGRIAHDEWFKTPIIRKNIHLGEFIVMPNHIHGIIIIAEKIRRGELNSPDSECELNSPDSECELNSPDSECELNSPDSECELNSPAGKGESISPLRPRSPSQTIGSIVRGYKSSVHRQINKLRNSPGGIIWQRNYWEHIIRDDQSLIRISEYIINNPGKWKDDKLNLI